MALAPSSVEERLEKPALGSSCPEPCQVRACPECGLGGRGEAEGEGKGEG